MDNALRKQLLEETIVAIKRQVSPDLFIIQAISHIDELAKTTNVHMKRFAEWMGHVLPELIELKSYEQAVLLTAEHSREELLRQLGLHEEESMGVHPTDDDYKQLQQLAKDIITYMRMKEDTGAYLEQLMLKECPNMSALAGVNIGARLIMHAGGIQRLAQVPASKIQLYGAEKALFRHLRTGAKSPKHGIIHEHPLVQRGGGKAARALADKLALAVKVDYFHGEPIAEKIRQELEQRFGVWS